MEKEAKEYIADFDVMFATVDIEFGVNTKVRHLIFGDGIVTEVDDKTGAITINFTATNTSRHFSCGILKAGKTLEILSPTPSNEAVNEEDLRKKAKQTIKENREYKSMLLASGIDPQSEQYKPMLIAAGIDPDKN